MEIDWQIVGKVAGAMFGVALFSWLTRGKLSDVPAQQDTLPTHTAYCVIEDEPLVGRIATEDSPSLTGVDKNLS